MPEDNYPQTPMVQGTPNNQQTQSPISLEVKNDIWPPLDDLSRINTYDFYESLFMGEHFKAFSIHIDNPLFGREYAKLRYVVANFPGLISKIVSDLLFIEPPKIKVPGGDQEFVDALVNENKLRLQNYESALANSYLGDNLYKIRIDKRNPNDTDATIIIEEVTPKIYFPKLDSFNIKADPSEKVLAWTFKSNNKTYLFKEIHTPGKIVNKVYELDANKIKSEVSLDITNIQGLKSEEDTKVNRSLIIHVPNFRAGNRYFGLSDYFDLETLFYAINNRITKTDNILDKHSDPILALPPGILDEEGKVKKSQMGMIERPEGASSEMDPSYITWDANLESAFVEVDKLVEMTFMMSETSPALLGFDKNGMAESGRALKFKLLRTLAKVQRKQLYYREALIEVIYTAQLLAKAWGVKVGGKKLEGEPVRPEIEWRDGLPADLVELVDIESKRIDAGLTTKTDSIMRLDDIDEDAAKKKAKEIKEENKVELPVSNVGADAEKFAKPVPNEQAK